jgi:hypothetical protein
MGREVAVEPFVVRVFESGLSGAHRVQRFAVGMPEPRFAVQARERKQRSGRVAAEKACAWREPELAARGCAKDPDGRQGAQQPRQRVGLGADGARKGTGSQWTLAQSIGDAEARRRVQHLRQAEPHDHLPHDGSVDLAVDRSARLVHRQKSSSEGGRASSPAAQNHSACGSPAGACRRLERTRSPSGAGDGSGSIAG